MPFFWADCVRKSGNKCKTTRMVFSSPELKAQVSYSDHRLSVCLSVCKLFTFSTSSPEPLGQFQRDLAQIILWERGFMFVQMKVVTLLQGEIIAKQ